MYGSNKGANNTMSRDSINSSSMRKVTEDMVVQKINKIFDEIQGDNNEFEESYTGLKKNTSQIIQDSSKSNEVFNQSSIADVNQRSGKKVRIVEDSRESFQQLNTQQQPMVVPVIINQQAGAPSASTGDVSMGGFN